MASRIALFAALLAGGVLSAQTGTTPKASEQDYPVHAKLDRMSIGVEYLIHSFSSGRDMFIAKDFLVVEVALFPAKGETVLVNSGEFNLRVNGRKEAIAPQGGEFVAAALEHPEDGHGVHPMVGLGPVVLGAPNSGPRFPGDPSAPPAQDPQRAPGTARPAQDKSPLTAEEVVVQAALPEGPAPKPTSGFLYFPYRGKLSRVHSLELIFSGPEGAARLPLL